MALETKKTLPMLPTLPAENKNVSTASAVPAVPLALRFNSSYDTNNGEGWDIESAGIEFLSLHPDEFEDLQKITMSNRLWYPIGIDEHGHGQFAAVSVELTETPIAEKWSTTGIYTELVVSKKPHESSSEQLDEKDYVKYKLEPKDTWIALKMNTHHYTDSSNGEWMNVGGVEFIPVTASEAAILKQLDSQGRLFCHVGHKVSIDYYAPVHVRELKAPVDPELSSCDVHYNLYFLREGSSKPKQDELIDNRYNDNIVTWGAFDDISELPRKPCAKAGCARWVHSAGDGCSEHVGCAKTLISPATFVPTITWPTAAPQEQIQMTAQELKDFIAKNNVQTEQQLVSALPQIK